jgi:hypothetical protein
MNTEKSTTTKERARILDVGRPKIRPPGEDTILSFKVESKLVKALDAEAARMSAERPAGSARISRTEAIKVVLYRWLESQAKPRQ